MLPAGTRTFVEHDLRGPIGHAVEAEHGKRAHDLHAGRVLADQDHGLLAVAVGAVRLGLAHEDDDLAARVGGPGGIPFAPVDDVFVAVARDRLAMLVASDDATSGSVMAKAERISPASSGSSHCSFCSSVP